MQTADLKARVTIRRNREMATGGTVERWNGGMAERRSGGTAEYTPKS